MEDKQLQQVLTNCALNTRIMASTFFPERFSAPFADNIHGEIFKLIDGPAQKVAIAAPRGFGKTSIVALALIARWILFRHTNFVVYINKSHDAASLQTENLRRELVSNKLIKGIFGPFKDQTERNSDFEEVFSKKAWVAYNTLVWPRGAGQQVRGVLFKNDRPGLIVIDDLEDADEVNNPETRDRIHQWLYADVVKSVSRLHHDWKIVYIDTLKHEDAVLQRLLNSPDWASIRLEACDDNLKSTAPLFMSDETIAKEWQDHVDAGQTDVFFRELRNLPISTHDSAFRQDYFHYYNLPLEARKTEHDLSTTDPEIQNDKNIETVVILDPAKTVKIHSAESAIVGIGIDLTSAKIYIRDIVSEKMYPDEIYEQLFGMATRLNAKVIGIEETSLSEFIRQPIKNEMFRRGSFFELVWLNARGGTKKELRIKELVPYYRGGYIYHNASCATMKKLEQQLLMFPRSALWDIMDATAYIIEMLEKGERYFSPNENPEDIESEFKELEYEEPIEDWRYA